MANRVNKLFYEAACHPITFKGSVILSINESDLHDSVSIHGLKLSFTSSATMMQAANSRLFRNLSVIELKSKSEAESVEMLKLLPSFKSLRYLTFDVADNSISNFDGPLQISAKAAFQSESLRYLKYLRLYGSSSYLQWVSSSIEVVCFQSRLILSDTIWETAFELFASRSFPQLHTICFGSGCYVLRDKKKLRNQVAYLAEDCLTWWN